MNTNEISMRLAHAATQYARRQSNPYALGIIMQAVDRAVEMIAEGATTRKALLVCFNDRLLSRMLKAVGEPDFTADERI